MSFFQSSIKNIIGATSKKGTDDGDNGSEFGSSRGGILEKKFEELSGLHVTEVTDGGKNAGREGKEVNAEMRARGEVEDLARNVESGGDDGLAATGGGVEFGGKDSNKNHHATGKGRFVAGGQASGTGKRKEDEISLTLRRG